MAVFGGKSVKNAPHMAFLGAHFLLIHSKNAENKMSFEIHVLLFTRSAPKNAIFGAFLTDFPPKTAIFLKKITPNLQNFRVFEKTQGPWEKNSSIWRKNSSFLASKLNEPVVTNYTRYHKSVEKKA